MIASERLILRPLEAYDADFLYEWENDSSLWMYSDTIAPLSKTLLYDYASNYDADIFKARQLRLIITMKDDPQRLPIGMIDIFDLDARHNRASVGILIIPTYREQGFAREAINLLADYAYKIIGLKSLTAHIPTINKSSISLFASCGFSDVGVLRQWHRYGTEYLDVALMQRLL